MKSRFHAGAVVLVCCLCAGDDSAACPQEPTRVSGAAQKGAGVTTRASGTFDVKVTPQASTGSADGAAIGRMSIDKLVGLAGKLAIQIAEGRHSYDFEYTLAQTP